MKAIGGFGVLLFLVATVYWVSASAGKGDDAPMQIQVAFGDPFSNGMELHAVVGVIMAARDRTDENGRSLTLDEWVTRHFELKDSSDNLIKLSRQNNSKIIPQNKVIGTQECFLVAKLDKDESYTFDYLPTMGDPTRYRYSFTTPAATEKVRNVDFQLVKKKK